MSELWPVALTVASAVTLVQGCALVALYSGLGRLLFQEDARYKALITEDGPPLNSRLLPVTGKDARTDEPVAAAQFRGRNLLLLFLSPGCDACDELLQAVLERQRGWREDTGFLIVVQASAAETAAYLSGLPGVPVLADPDGRVFEDCGVERTPLGVLVDAWGYVRMKGIVNTRDQLAGLIAGQGRPVTGLSWVPVAGRDLPAAEAVVGSGPARNGSNGFEG